MMKIDMTEEVIKKLLDNCTFTFNKNKVGDEPFILCHMGQSCENCKFKIHSCRCRLFDINTIIRIVPELLL